MNFKNITLSDREPVESYLKPGGYMGCEYSFVNMFIWQETYHVQYAVEDGVLYLRSHLPIGDVYFLCCCLSILLHFLANVNFM